MATIIQISNSLLIAKAYYVQLLDQDTTALQGGFPVRNRQKIECLKKLIYSLTWDLDVNVNDATTTAVYELLLNEIFSFTGQGVVVDPNVIIPGNTIIVVGTSTPFNQSQPIFFTNQTEVTLANYQTAYRPLYGNQPILVVFTVQDVMGQPVWTEDTATVPTITYVNNDPTKDILYITWTYGTPTSGFIQISGLKPTS